MMIVNGTVVSKGKTVLFRNGELREVMEPPLPIINGYGVVFDEPLEQGGGKYSLFENFQGNWIAILPIGPDDAFEIIDVGWDPQSLGGEAPASRTPPCNCSMAWCDSTEETWPHKKDCAYLKYSKQIKKGE
jgi:hypothetical protein